MGENLSIFKKGLVLVAIPLLFQLGFIALMVQMRQESREDYRWSSQTKVVLAEIESTFRRLVEAHSDMHGYIITGEPAFAQAYDHAVAALPGAIGKLRSLVRDPGQQERLARIEQRSARLLGFLGELKWLMETGAQGKAVAAVKSLTGKEPMDALGEAIGAFLNREDALDAEYYAALERAWRQEEYFLMAGLMLSLIFAVGTAYVFSYGISRRLGILMRNIERLGEGEGSLAPLGGRDEIGQMDAAFQQMARALARRTTALTASNHELQNFAAIASHDLQEPLRKIEAFGSRLAAKSADTLDPQGREYLERMIAAARRMRTLITDLLTFARVTTKARPFVPTDLTQAAQEAFTDLEAHIEASSARVELGPLPTVEADPLQMRQLLQNLIGNGLKFHRPGEPVWVRVEGKILDAAPSAEAERTPSTRCEIRVQDNGIGFEEAYLDRIFELFQRLHGRNEYEGTGMGLAICRKIAERHGGGITAQSAPGQGATFIVTLPLTQPKGEDREGNGDR
jgi:signal transduction histidine kinase